MLPLLLMLSCRESEPVLTGVEEPQLLGNITSAEENRTVPANKEKIYQKLEGVYIDVPYLGGRSFLESRGVLAEQLGDLIESTELPFNHGRMYEYEKGIIQVLNDEMYRFQIPLPFAMRRSQAFQIMGFPEQIDNYMITHKEYRVENEWEFRRFRLRREDTKSEMVTHFEAWKWTPNER